MEHTPDQYRQGDHPIQPSQDSLTSTLSLAGELLLAKDPGADMRFSKPQAELGKLSLKEVHQGNARSAGLTRPTKDHGNASRGNKDYSQSSLMANA